MHSQNKCKTKSRLAGLAPSCNEKPAAKPELIEKLLQAGLLWNGSVPAGDRVAGGRVAGSAEKALDSTEFSKEPAAVFGIPELDQSLPWGGLKSGLIHEFFSGCDFRIRDSQPGASVDSLAAQNHLPSSDDYLASYAAPYPPCTLLTLLAGSIVNNSPRSPCEKLLVWIDRECWPTPYLLNSVFVSEDIFSRCIFLDPPNQRLKRWCLEAALASPAVIVVIAKAPALNFTASRRLALLAKRAPSLGLLIRPAAELHTSSSAATRWIVHPASSIFSAAESSTNKAAASFTGAEQPRWKLRLLKCRGGRPSQSSWIVEQAEGSNEEISLHLSPVLADRAEPPQISETA